MIRTIQFFVVCIFCFGCKLAEQEPNLDKEVIYFMIDRYARMPPPPPDINSSDTNVPQRVLDSLDTLKLGIAVWPAMTGEIYTERLTEVAPRFRQLFKPGVETVYLDEEYNSISKKGHRVFIADTLEIKKSMDFDDNIDLLFHFSRIYYNDERTKALFELGISKSRLAGSAYIFCLEKERGEWKRRYTIPTVEW